jgi:drug/metabolite transporter (DMT)-like permease
MLYLAIAATIVAFALQLYGQRYVMPATASTIYLVEPASAPIFAMLLINEKIEAIQVAGFSLIILALYLSTTSKYSYK